MKIAFCNLPWFETHNGETRQGIRAGSRWPFTKHLAHDPGHFKFGGYLPVPFFLTHAAGYTQMLLPEAEVVVRDSIARGETYSDFGFFLQSFRPEWLVIETASPSWPHDQEVIRKMIAPLGIKVLLCGTLPEAEHQAILDAFPCVHAIMRGEYDKLVAKAIAGGRGVYQHDLLTATEMLFPPFPIWDNECLDHYWDGCPVGHQPPQLQLWTSRGCPYRCLSGDVPVNTVLGNIPIKELSDKFTEIGVFTYDPVEKRALVSTAKNIRKLGENEKLVRVHFDDGTHIDCTPDHKLIAFKWGNQHTGEREWISEAQELEPGTHVRALKTSMSGQYMSAAWTRYGGEKVHRMIAEWKIGRRLQPSEQVHHIDHNKLNNHPDNLLVTSGAKEHFAHHPEISQRMRENNPTKNGMSPEWIAKLSLANKGKVRSAESRERYRLAAIKREAAKSQEQKKSDAAKMMAGWKKSKNLRQRDGSGKFLSDNGVINHRVIKVEPLEGLHDVYCLEVPETGWFYANNVLVKNCCFCVFPAVMTGNDPDGLGKRSVRFHSPEWVESYIQKMRSQVDFKSVYLDDDTFNLNQNHTLKICATMKRVGLPWSAMCRADTIDRNTWKAMRDSGCFGVKIGFESGSQWVVDHIVNKRLDIAEAHKTCHFLQHELGMKVHTTWTVGLPGEKPEHQRQTLQLIEAMYQDGSHTTHQISGTAVVDGTPLDHIARGEHLVKYDGATNEGFVASPDGQLKIESML